MPFILNDKSPQYGKIPFANIDLKPHQQAIVKKMFDMETDFFQFIHDKKSKRMAEVENIKKRVESGEPLTEEMQQRIDFLNKQDMNDIEPFGVLGSTVGSGKTYCAIALCLIEKFKKKSWVDRIFSNNTSMSTMIVVPSHLYYQWVDSINNFAGNALTIEHLDNYDSILSMYNEKTEVIKSADIYLVSDLFYQMVASTMVTMKLSFKRVIFDEIDSIKNSLHTTISAAYTWFVSGSFKEMLSKQDEPFKFGDIKIPIKSLLNNYIGCDDNFVLQSFQIPEYTFKSITCDNQTIDALKYCLDQDALLALNSCDPQTALMKTGLEAVAHIPNDKEFVTILEERWKNEVQQLDEYCTSLEKKFNDLTEKQQKAKVRDINLTRNIERIKNEKEDKLKKHGTLKTKLETLQEEMKKVTLFHEDRPKLVKLQNLIETHKEGKVLIFAEFPRVLIEVSKMLEDNNIKYSNFEGGNNEEMYNSVQKFKEEDDVNVFLAHSTLFSCGMNLENITHIIFLHRIKAEVQKQVIGRGQRPGRTCPLMVYELLYKNEKTLKI